MAEKLDRKALKRPDEFQVVAGRSMTWMIAHKTELMLGLGAVVLASLVAWGVSAYNSSRENNAGGALDQAIELETRPIAGDPMVPPGVETFPSKAERTKAALADLDKVHTDFPTTRAGKTALAESGFLKQGAGDNAGAVQDLQSYLAQDGQSDDTLRPFATESLGYALEGLGKLDDAKAAFAKLADQGEPARAAYQQARIALLQGKPDAKQQLEQVAKDYPKDPVGQEAEQRVLVAGLPPLPPPGSQKAAPEPEKSAPTKVLASKKKPHAKKK